MPTNGNAGAAWATYAARGGHPLDDRYAAGRAGDHPQRGRRGRRRADPDRRADRATPSSVIAELLAAPAAPSSTLAHCASPYRLEGKKTMGYEICEQLGWRVPDVIIYPTGGGVGLIGIHKALEELRELGWIGDKLPRAGGGAVDRLRADRAGVLRPAPAGPAAVARRRAPSPSGSRCRRRSATSLILDALAAATGAAPAVARRRRRDPCRRAGVRRGRGPAALPGGRRLPERRSPACATAAGCPPATRWSCSTPARASNTRRPSSIPGA